MPPLCRVAFAFSGITWCGKDNFGLSRAGKYGPANETIDQTPVISQDAKQFYGLSKVFHRINPIPVDAMRHAKQVQGFGYPLRILLELQKGKRLLMCLQALRGLPCIDQPVAQTVEAVSVHDRIIGVSLAPILCKCKGLTEKYSCLLIVTSYPEEAKVYQALPLDLAFTSIMGDMQCLLVIAARPLKVAQRFVGPSTQVIERCRGRNRCLLCGMQGARKLLNGGTRGVHGLSFFPGPLPIFQGLLPGACLVEVIGQVGYVRIEDRRVEALHRFGNGAVQGLTLAYQQVGIHRLPCQRMAEGKALLRLFDH